MYYYIYGKIVKQLPTAIVIENNGIGYLVNVSNPYSYPLDKMCTVYLYELVREDEHCLYGFKEEIEKDMFLSLISVKGLGPKMALPMLATGSISGISDAIERENVLYLKKFPKIGDKLAKQIILDLKGKISKIDGVSSSYEDLIEVLKGLGYKDKDYMNILGKVDSSLTIEEQVKDALRLLLK